VLGVAGLVAILAHLGSGDPLVTYRHGVEMIIAFFLTAALVAATTLMGRPRVAASVQQTGSALGEGEDIGRKHTVMDNP
jgi:hypothetical protein